MSFPERDEDVELQHIAMLGQLVLSRMARPEVEEKLKGFWVEFNELCTRYGVMQPLEPIGIAVMMLRVVPLPKALVANALGALMGVSVKGYHEGQPCEVVFQPSDAFPPHEPQPPAAEPEVPNNVLKFPTRH